MYHLHEKRTNPLRTVDRPGLNPQIYSIIIKGFFPRLLLQRLKEWGKWRPRALSGDVALSLLHYLHCLFYTIHSFPPFSIPNWGRICTQATTSKLFIHNQATTEWIRVLAETLNVCLNEITSMEHLGTWSFLHQLFCLMHSVKECQNNIGWNTPSLHKITCWKNGGRVHNLSPPPPILNLTHSFPIITRPFSHDGIPTWCIKEKRPFGALCLC